MGSFNGGMFNCLDNPTLCIFTYCCHCIVIGQNAQATGAGPCIVYGIMALFPIANCYAMYNVRKAAREAIGAPAEHRSLDDNLVWEDAASGIAWALCSSIQIKKHYAEAKMGETMDRS